MQMTYGQLVDAANAKRTEEWDQTANLLCLLHNAHRGSNSSPSRPEDWHPLRKRKRRRSKYTADVVRKMHSEIAANKPVLLMTVRPDQVIDDD